MEYILSAMLRIVVQRHCCSQVITVMKYYISIYHRNSSSTCWAPVQNRPAAFCFQKCGPIGEIYWREELHFLTISTIIVNADFANQHLELVVFRNYCSCIAFSCQDEDLYSDSSFIYVFSDGIISSVYMLIYSAPGLWCQWWQNSHGTCPEQGRDTWR